jgi:C4-type Zn-finger protein
MKAVREALDELKRRGIDADIVICPVCKSARLVEITSFRDLGYIGSFQPAYYCLDCGWFGRFNVTMSNRDLEEAVLKDMSDAHPELLEDSPEDEDELYEIS